MTAPGQDEPIHGGGWSRRMRRAATDHIGLKVTSLLIALLLWFIVHVMRGAGGMP